MPVSLKKSLSKFAWSTRVRNAFKNEGWETLADLVYAEPWVLRRLSNLGDKSRKEIDEVLASIGLKVGMKKPEIKKPLWAKAHDAVEKTLQQHRWELRDSQRRLGNLESRETPTMAEAKVMRNQMTALQDQVRELKRILNTLHIDGSWISVMRDRLHAVEAKLAQIQYNQNDTRSGLR